MFSQLRALLACLPLILSGAAAAETETEAWPNYEVILYQRQPDTAYPGLPRLGISGGMILGQRDNPADPAWIRERVAPFRANGLGWYVENVATDFYSAYHRWTPHRPENWLFTEAQRRYRENPGDPTIFQRDPSLLDPTWRARIARRLTTHARLHRMIAAPGRPFFLDLGDEPGIADLAAEWDFDRGPASLAAFRRWLRGHYPSLAALNARWHSAFANWEAVLPMTTAQAIAAPETSFAPWVDFKAFMDESFAEAIRFGRAAVRAGDPALPVAIAGGQMPGTGGWNYALLAQAVDVIEGGPAEVIGGLNPALDLYTTSHEASPTEWHRLWQLALLGHRGVVLWDGEADIIAADGTPGPRGAVSAPHFQALRSGLSAQLRASTVERASVGILYSQPSFRLRWLLDRRSEAGAGGPPWNIRTSETEWKDDNAWRQALFGAIDGLAGAGIRPHWLTPERLTPATLAGLHILVLPHSIALSDAEVAAIRGFANSGRIVIADAAKPGLFDNHGVRRPVPPLDSVPIRHLAHFAKADLAPILAAAGVLPEIGVDATVPVETRFYRNGVLRLVAVQAAKPQPGPSPLTLRLPAKTHLRPLGPGPAAVLADQASVTLDPVRPTIFVLSPIPLPAPKLTRVGQGVRLALDGPSPAARHILRLDLLDTDGQADPARLRLVAMRPDAALTLPAPPPGRRLRATDLLGGREAVLP